MHKHLMRSAIDIMNEKGFGIIAFSLFTFLVSLLAFLLFGIVLGVALAIICLITTASAKLYLDAVNAKKFKCVDLFSVIKEPKMAIRIIGGLAWRELNVLLWFLIPVAGIYFGMKKAYAYSLTAYILLNNPDVKTTEAIKVSEEITLGYKRHLLGADAIPVIIYAVITIALILLVLICYSGKFVFGVLFFEFLAVVVTCGFFIFYNCFRGLVHAKFYNEMLALTDKI